MQYRIGRSIIFRHIHTRYARYLCTCASIGGTFKENNETIDSACFSLDELPERPSTRIRKSRSPCVLKHTIQRIGKPTWTNARIKARRRLKCPKDRTYIYANLKSFYASVECRERGLDPLTTNLVVADPERTEDHLPYCGLSCDACRGRTREVQSIPDTAGHRLYDGASQNAGTY